MAHLQPPVPAPEWLHDAKQIRAQITEAISKDKAVNDQVGAIPHEQVTFDNVVRALSQSETDLEVVTGPLTFYSNVATEDDRRDASVEGQRELSDYATSAESRMDVYKALVAVKDGLEKTGEKLDAESQRLLDKMIQERERAGLGLDEDKRKKVVELKNKINTLVVDFMKAYNEEKGTILFTEEELEGVPKDVLSGLKLEKDASDGKEKLVLSFKTPEYVPTMRYAKNPLTRRRALVGYESKLAANSPLLESIISLRREQAALLGYANWADYRTEVKMVKNGKAVQDFLDDLLEKLTPVGQKDKEALLAIKKKEEGDKSDGKLYVWDYNFYSLRRIEQEVGLDDEIVKEYFPVSVVVSKILEIYQKLLAVRFVPVQNAKVWHKDVQQFAVWESDATGKDGEGFLGFMHLDLFPRENKYGHAAVWGLIPGFTTPEGKRSYPVAAMVANLAKETPERPALMKHDDVVTFFHEMGHAFHQLCSKTQYGRFHGTSVARDFVEAPSQMLENWCWLVEQLKEMSSHYKTGEALSQDLIDRILKSRNVNSGLFNLRQLFFGLYDMHLHTNKEGDVQDFTKLWCELREKVSLVEFDGEYAPGQSSFAHIIGGYDAGYYGYLYSLVFAADMFKTVFSPDPLSAKFGARYRDEILRPGGSRDEMDSLVAFLGREPNNEAFLDQLLGRE